MRTQARWSLRGLRTFCIAARYASFSQAAERLFVTASAVSHQIKNLEDELGQKLFERKGRTLLLTRAGEFLFAELDPIMTQVDEVAQRWRAQQTRTPLRVSVQPFFSSELLVPRLKRFTESHPAIDIQLESSDEAPERHPRTADLSIRLFRQPPSDLAADALFPIRLTPACSAELAQKITDPQEFYREPFNAIVHTGRPNAWRNWAVSLGVELAEPISVHKLDTMLGVVSAAEQGLGLALVPKRLAQDRFDRGRLVQLHPTELTLTECYYLVYDKRRGEGSPVAEFRQWALQEFS